MATHDEYDKKLLKGIEKISDRLDKIEKKMPREVEQEGSVILPALYRLAKENNCSISIGIYPNNCVFLEVRVGQTPKHDFRVIDSSCSEEDLIDIFKDTIRTAKECSDE